MLASIKPSFAARQPEPHPTKYVSKANLGVLSLQKLEMADL
jgi:hypothetical protein